MSDNSSRPSTTAFAHSHVGQEVLGITLLALGGALTLTLWLLPLGLPVALFGIGLMSAPSD